MLGLRCEVGEDNSRRGRDGFRPGFGRSFIAFDFKREHLVIKAELVMPKENLPPALRPLDAEVAFDDIVSQGVNIRHKEIPSAGRQQKQYEVTFTVTCRRPPKFYTEFEASGSLKGSINEERGRGRMPVRRRATAIDFAITGVVSASALILLICADGDQRGTDQNRYGRSMRLRKYEFKTCCLICYVYMYSPLIGIPTAGLSISQLNNIPH